ncbi:MAG: DUF2961 domain-containing protein [Bacteroidales bacterium]|nr:DUF2961 domain-containing protein [Bacteroidales bacterium]
MIRLFLSLILMFLVLSSGGQALYDKPHDINTRWASAENWTGKKGGGGTANGGRKGSPSFRLNAGQTKTLAEVSGSSGIVRRIWLTIDQRTPEMLRGLQIEMYWDDASEPAVSAPLGDLFNHGLGQMSVLKMHCSPALRVAVLTAVYQCLLRKA